MLTFHITFHNTTLYKPFYYTLLHFLKYAVELNYDIS